LPGFGTKGMLFVYKKQPRLNYCDMLALWETAVNIIE